MRFKAIELLHLDDLKCNKITEFILNYLADYVTSDRIDNSCYALYFYNRLKYIIACILYRLFKK